VVDNKRKKKNVDKSSTWLVT